MCLYEIVTKINKLINKKIQSLSLDKNVLKQQEVTFYCIQQEMG